MALHLTGWRVSAGDELTVFDGNSCKIVAVSAGGMAGRTFKEAEEVARLIAAAPELLEALEGALAALDGRTEVLDSAICCSGHECGCRGASNRDLLLHDLRNTIAKARGDAA